MRGFGALLCAALAVLAAAAEDAPAFAKDELEALRRMIAELQDKLADAAALAVKVQLEHEAALERQSAAFQRAKAAREREELRAALAFLELQEAGDAVDVAERWGELASAHEQMLELEQRAASAQNQASPSTG